MSIFRDCHLSYNFRDIFSTRIAMSNCQILVATSIFLNLLLSTSSFNHLLHYHSFNIFTSSPVTAKNVVLFESAFVKSLVGWRKMRQPIDVDRTSLVTSLRIEKPWNMLHIVTVSSNTKKNSNMVSRLQAYENLLNLTKGDCYHINYVNAKQIYHLLIQIL